MNKHMYTLYVYMVAYHLATIVGHHKDDSVSWVNQCKGTSWLDTLMSVSVRPCLHHNNGVVILMVK